MTGNGKKAACP